MEVKCCLSFLAKVTLDTVLWLYFLYFVHLHISKSKLEEQLRKASYCIRNSVIRLTTTTSGQLAQRPTNTMTRFFFFFFVLSLHWAFWTYAPYK